MVLEWISNIMMENSSRFLSSSSSKDDDFSTQKQTDQLKNVLYINIVIFIFLVVLFEMLRHMKAIFLNRYCGKYIKLGRVPPKPSIYPFAWLYTISQVSEDDILRMIGLDGYMLLRYLTVCFRTACFFAFFGAVILAPVYSSGDFGLQGWGSYTLANIPSGPTNYLWVPVIFSYIFSMFFCQLMYLEYINFKEKRVHYIMNGDADTPAQTYYTVMIERLPAPLRSTAALHAFFDRLFPGQVFNVEIAVDLHDLEDLVHHRRLIRNKLEKAIAIYKATKVRPQEWVKPSIYAGMEAINRPTPLESRPEGNIVYNLNLKFAHCWGFEVHDAIDHFEFLLDIFNANVAQLQRAYFIQRQQLEFIEGAENSRLAVFRNKLANHERIGTVVQKLEQMGKQGQDILTTSSKKLLKKKDDRAGNEDNTAVSDAKCNEIESPFSVSDTSSADDASAGVNSSQRATALTTGAKFLNTGVENIAREGFETAKVATKGAWKGVRAATRALELLTVGAYYKVSSTGFVTFTTRVAKSSAEQMLLSHEHYNLLVTPAPNPHDLLWPNVSIPQPQIAMRKLISGILFGIGALFWSLVVAFISAISNLESIAQVIPSLQSYSNTEIYNLLNNYLAIGLLLLLLALLPFVFDFVSRSYEGLKQESEIQNSIMARYFYYSLANVFVAVGLGSIASSLHQIIEDPTSILHILGASVPSFSTYFASLLIIRTCTVVPIEMLRLIPLLDILGVSFCYDKRKCTRRELRTGAFADPPMLYGWIYPNIIMVLMILFTYSCIAPFIAPLAAAYFGLVYIMYKYQLLYVYINRYQSGGFMWYAVFDRSMLGLLCGVLTLLCYLAIRQTYTTGPLYALLPLPVLITVFWQRCNEKFMAPARSLSLERAQELDEAQKWLLSRDDEHTASSDHIDPSTGSNNPNNEGDKKDNKPVTTEFTRTLFRQPSLAEGKLKPAPYRIAARSALHHQHSRVLQQPLSNTVYNPFGTTTSEMHPPGTVDALRASFASESDRMSLSRYLDPEYDEELQTDDYEMEQEVSQFLEQQPLEPEVDLEMNLDMTQGEDEREGGSRYLAMQDESPVSKSPSSNNSYHSNNNNTSGIGETKEPVNSNYNASNATSANYGSMNSIDGVQMKEVQSHSRVSFI